jgi:hypothetical protein
MFQTNAPIFIIATYFVIAIFKFCKLIWFSSETSVYRVSTKAKIKIWFEVDIADIQPVNRILSSNFGLISGLS